MRIIELLQPYLGHRRAGVSAATEVEEAKSHMVLWAKLRYVYFTL